MDEGWAQLAACRDADPDAFFPDRGSSGAEAKRVCVELCEVRETCLQHALRHREYYGVWGGLSARERKLLHARHDGHVGRDLFLAALESSDDPVVAVADSPDFSVDADVDWWEPALRVS